MRRGVIAGGLLILAAVWLGPLPQLARQAFFAHMLMHMGVVAVAAPMLALAIAGGRFDATRQAPRLFAPIPASILELVVVWAWHAPALHHAARHHTVVLIIEQGMFFVAGVFVWLSAFGGNSARRSNRSGARASGDGSVNVGNVLAVVHVRARPPTRSRQRPRA